MNFSMRLGGGAMLALVVALAGCGGGATPGRKNVGDVTVVKRGWAPGEVRNKIGKPREVIPGEWLELGQEEWVYPNGSVIFRRMQVVEVRERRRGDPLPQRPRGDELDYSLLPYGEEDEYYRLRDEENSRRREQYEKTRKRLVPARSRRDVDMDRRYEESRRARDADKQPREPYQDYTVPVWELERDTGYYGL